ncbi:MAG: FtsX-like permease family protein, partial [Acidobacteriota bacterium]
GRLSKGRGGAGDDGILGRTITVDEVQHTVVGVLPPGLAYPDGEVDLWLPLGGAPRGRGFYYLSMLGRLEDGVTPQQLTARFAAFGPTMPNGPVDSPIDLVATPMRENLVGDLRPQLSLFLAAVATVLLIACLNATHLILIRALGRRRELALRAALGAGRGPLLRQLVVEGCALGLLGGILGTALAFGILEGLRSLGPEWMPRPEELGLDGTALAFAFGLSLALGALLGAATAVRATADDPSLGMTGARGEVGGGQRSRAALIVVQLAGAVVLLSTALLLVSSYRSIESRESGFDPGGTLMVDLDLPAGRYGTRQEQGAYYAQLLEELRSLPGVTAAAVASSHPFTFYINHGIELDGGQDESNLASRVRLVSDGYPETTGLTVLEGRFVEERDGWNAVVVNATLARRLAPGGSAVGLRIKLRNIEPETWRTVVGVVADVEHYGRLAHWQHAMYVPAQGVPYPHPMTPILRTEGDPLALGPSIRERILAVDPRVPAGALVPLDDLLWRAKSEPRLRTTLLGGFGALALVLAMTGLYGVMAFWVADRGKEFGVRQALGANRAGIVGMVLLHALGRVGLGVGLGLALTWPALALVRHQIPDLAPAEPTLQGTAVLLLALTALLACWIPARRAAGVDPITALREE